MWVLISHDGVMGCWLAFIDGIKTDGGVDCEVGKMEVYVDRVEMDEEVNKCHLWLLESGCA